MGIDQMHGWGCLWAGYFCSPFRLLCGDFVLPFPPPDMLSLLLYVTTLSIKIYLFVSVVAIEIIKGPLLVNGEVTLTGRGAGQKHCV